MPDAYRDGTLNTISRSIAVVDDEEPVRRALERYLRAASLTVETYASGDAFLIAMSTHKPDCLVLDLHLPEMDGFAVLARLKQLGAGVPVVTITGHDTTESRDRALAGGAAEYLRKPIDGQTLLDAIAAAIETQCSNRAGDRTPHE